MIERKLFYYGRAKVQKIILMIESAYDVNCALVFTWFIKGRSVRLSFVDPPDKDPLFYDKCQLLMTL